MNRDMEDWGNEQHAVLERLYRNGALPALIEAIAISGRCRIPIPKCAVKGIVTVLDEVITGDLEGRMGRHTNWLKQYEQDMIDLERAETVEKLREHGVKWKYVYETASQLLEGTESRGAAGTIETAYKRFRKREKTSPWRYHAWSYYKPIDIARPASLQRLKIIEDVLKFEE